MTEHKDAPVASADALLDLQFISDRYGHTVEDDGEDNWARFAAIEAAIRGEGLDVELLAEAMVLAFRAEAKENWPFLKGDGWPAYDETGHPTQVMRYKVIGARVAAEYARLAAQPG